MVSKFIVMVEQAISACHFTYKSFNLYIIESLYSYINLVDVTPIIFDPILYDRKAFTKIVF